MQKKTVEDHYAASNLEQTILDALVSAGKNLDDLKPEDLAPIDEFHARGVKATIEMADDLGPCSHDMQILDLGCGLGGASRYLARRFGCRVVGLDLNEEYCKAAACLTRLLRQDTLVSFRQGNALFLPFPDASFDVVWTQHSAMNISDKPALYAEIWRVLKPGGRLALNDVLAGQGGDVRYPVPWAGFSEISYLVKPQELSRVLAEKGFETILWQDRSEAGVTWFRNLLEKQRGKETPAVGLHLLLGKGFRIMAENLLLNLVENRVILIEAILQRPDCWEKLQ